MDFSLGSRLEDLLGQVRSFMDEHVYPVEAEAMAALDEEVKPGVAYPEIIIGIREKARAQGLWNLFLPDEEHGTGLTNWEYGLLCEEMGRSPVVAPMAFNCAAPDTGNMEILPSTEPMSRSVSGSSRCSTSTRAPASR
ncbi:MAG: acyl-CoA dehydrogenase family protein [Solirubrobacterales bacterium]|nr:acyl-CoA dehydrogenase family protein [Solirubrobacterales bacterium]